MDSLVCGSLHQRDCSFFQSDKCKKFADQQLERDRWVWAINAEMERMVRSHLDVEEARRYSGKVPDT